MCVFFCCFIHINILERLDTKIWNVKISICSNGLPILGDLRDFQFVNLLNIMAAKGTEKIDVLLMDPPWKISQSNPSRGVKLNYNCWNISDFFDSNKWPLKATSTVCCFF